jgi:hypothetical protein
VPRAGILLLSVVCCGFGLLSLSGPADWRGWAYAANVALAVACYFLAGRDLRERGWELGYLFAGAYLLPLVGLIVYYSLSMRPKVA